jgi:hypothetical protein
VEALVVAVAIGTKAKMSPMQLQEATLRMASSLVVSAEMQQEVEIETVEVEAEAEGLFASPIVVEDGSLRAAPFEARPASQEGQSGQEGPLRIRMAILVWEMRIRTCK